MKILPVNKILNSTQVTKKINNVAIPVLATPIIMAMEDIYGNYYNMSSLIISSSDSSKTRHAKEILKFMHDNDIEKPLYLKPHYDTKDGFDYNSKQKIKNALEKAYKENKITKDEYKQYRDKITFTGNKGNTDINNLSDSPSTSEIDDIDITQLIYTDDDSTIIDGCNYTGVITVDGEQIEGETYQNQNYEE